MMDLVQRLRDNAGPGGELGEYADALQKEAAAELDRLQRENAELRGAIRADNARLREAGERVGLFYGCDTAEMMADAIEDLRRVAARNCGTIIVPETDELERLQREASDLVDWVRVVMEETVLAGYPGGDRNQTLQNIRDMRADAKRLDWLSKQTQEASIRFDDGIFRLVKAWAISASFDDLRMAIDAAMANHSEPVQNPQP
jgi:hypothetical protein